MSGGSQAEFEAAEHLLRAPIIEARTAPYIRSVLRDIDFGPILDAMQTWSSGEQLLVKAALDMWNGDGEAKLGQLIHTLDESNLQLVLEAIAIRRGLR